ncbi:MAG: zinc ribbon domain-containing protein [Oscillospiraceae bacterium]|nr:zinc ribbon domain-containing protein [Oscillospiraceae bacterium]
MFCKFCGQQVPDGSAVCPVCGAPLAAAPAPAAPQQTFGQQTSYGQQQTSYGQQQTSYGQQQAYVQPAPASVSSGLSGDLSGAAGGRLPFRLIAKIALLLALVAFCFPFVTVSCDLNKLAALGGLMGGMSAEDADEMEEAAKFLNSDGFGWGPYNGFSIMFGKLDARKIYGIPDSMKDEFDEGFEEGFKKGLAESTGSDTSDVSMDQADFGNGINIWMLLSFLCGGAAVAMLFVFEKKPNKMSHVCAGLGAGGAAFLLIGRIAFISCTKLNMFASYGDYLKSHTKWGFFLCLLFFLAGAGACVMDFLSHKRSSPASFTGGGYPQMPGGGYPPAQNPVNQFGNYNQSGPPMQ